LSGGLVQRGGFVPDKFGQELIKVLDLHLELGYPLQQEGLYLGMLQLLKTAAVTIALADKGASQLQPFTQNRRCFRQRLTYSCWQQLRRYGQHTGIQGIGFRFYPQGTRQLPWTLGGQAHSGQVCLVQALEQGLFITATGLEDDALTRHLLQPSHQLGQADG